jgi:ribonucleoside-diphosphate reductase subunit M2
MQAATSLETFKMGESPAKKLSFDSENKENAPSMTPVLDVVATESVAEKATAPQELPKAAPLTIKELEAQEPLLQENPHRFVLFPIKYHEVSHAVLHDASRVKRLRVGPGHDIK